MKKMKTQIITILLLLSSFYANASTIVLLNGLSQNNDWRLNNIDTNLSKYHKVETIRLPYRESIQYQSQFLNEALKKIQGDIIIIAHSAGGIVSRNVIVRGNNKNIKSLITVSTPHLGSDLATYGSILNDKMPFGNMFSRVMLPNEASASIPISQLKNRSTFLKSLNSQKHPNLCYVSIIKTGGYINNAFANIHSQDMNNIPGFVNSGQKSLLIRSNTGHGLDPSDVIPVQKAIYFCERKL